MASKRRTGEHIRWTDTDKPWGQKDSRNKYSLDRVNPEYFKFQFHNT